MLTFEQACINVGLPVTRRQLNKFKTKRGLAYKLRNTDLMDEPDRDKRKQIALKLSNG